MDTTGTIKEYRPDASSEEIEKVSIFYIRFSDK